MIGWGLIGASTIARQYMVRAISSQPDSRIVAIASSNPERGRAFAAEHGIPAVYDTVEDLLADPAVNAVYISTTNELHAPQTIAAARAGKHVLCEKPFAINAAEAEEMIAAARERRLFLMEGVWMRFLPLMDDLRALLRDGAIGDVRMFLADFGFQAEFDPKSRLFDPRLAGGSLLDVGIYPVNMASLLFGRPEQIASVAHIGETGVDEQAAMVLRYSGGRLASLTSSIRTDTPNEAFICGSEGSIRIHRRWWVPEIMTVTAGARQETIHRPMVGNGYVHEAEEVMRCIREGRTESPLMPLDETLAIMRTLDDLRAQWGLVYPQERAA